MSTTRKIAHNTITQIVGKIISTLLGLLALGMLTRYLGHEQFGWYITAITFLQFVGILMDFGLTPVTAQMLSDPAYEPKSLFKNLLGFRFASAVIFLALAPFAALFFPYPLEVKIAISFTTINFLAIAMNQVLVGLYQTKLKMHIQAIGEIIGRIVLVGGLWILMQKGSTFLPIMWIITASSLAYLLYLWIYAFKETRATLAFDWQMWKEIMKKMWPIAVAIVFNVIYLKGDTILLSLFRPQAEVGIYGAAYRVIDILTQVAMMLMGVILPLLAFNWARNLKQEFKKLYQQAFDAMMLLAMPMMFMTIILAEKVMKLVAGNDFAIAGRPLQILAIAVFGLYLGAVFGHTAVAINRQKQTMWIYISDAIITLIGYLIFIPRFGMYGAAWMTVFSELYAGILLWITIRYYSQEKLQLKTFGKILLSSLIMTLVLILLIKLNVILLALIGLITYGLMLLTIKGISKNTLKEIFLFKQNN